MKLRHLLVLLAACFAATAVNAVEILNASYDVSRELFDDINLAFAAQWKKQTGETVEIRQSHGGSFRWGLPSQSRRMRSR